MATYPIAPPMTVDEFIRAYGDDNRLELIDGEVCEREVNGSTHFTVKNRISKLFDKAGIDRLGYGCFVEASFRLTARMGVTPDASVIRLDRLQSLSGNPILTGSPEIPIEVSISDNASVLERKIVAYLENGAHSVCLIYPVLRSVVIYTATGRRRLAEGEHLEFPELLPGLSISVSDIFAEL
jgi:Uma2 family endonuclease